MALMNRARAVALAGVTSLALMAPLAPAAAAPATPASGTAASVVNAEERRERTSRGSRSFAARAQRVMNVGGSLKGVPYRYGGSTPRGFDCSGFTSYVYRKVGVRLPHSATGQMHRAKRISRSQARKGDLVFFLGGRGAYHVGIYAGGNRVLHSPRPGQRVHTANIWSRNVAFGRVL